MKKLQTVLIVVAIIGAIAILLVACAGKNTAEKSGSETDQTDMKLSDSAISAEIDDTDPSVIPVSETQEETDIDPSSAFSNEELNYINAIAWYFYNGQYVHQFENIDFTYLRSRTDLGIYSPKQQKEFDDPISVAGITVISNAKFDNYEFDIDEIRGIVEWLESYIPTEAEYPNYRGEYKIMAEYIRFKAGLPLNFYSEEEMSPVLDIIGDNDYSQYTNDIYYFASLLYCIERQKEMGNGHPYDPINQCFPSQISGIDFGKSDVEGCFIYDRDDELHDVIQKYDTLGKTTRSRYHNIMWYVVHELNLTREDLEVYNSLLSKNGSHRYLTDDQIDRLLIEDEIEASKALRNVHTLFSNVENEVYNLPDLLSMTKEEFATLGFASDDIERCLAFLDEYENEGTNYHVLAEYIRFMADVPMKGYPRDRIHMYGVLFSNWY